MDPLKELGLIIEEAEEPTQTALRNWAKRYIHFYRQTLTLSEQQIRDLRGNIDEYRKHEDRRVGVEMGTEMVKNIAMKRRKKLSYGEQTEYEITVITGKKAPRFR